MGHLPLPAGGEAGAAPAPEAGGQDLVDDLLGGLLREGPAQGLVPASADVLIDILRIDDAAVAQGDAELLLIELCLGQAGDPLGVLPLLVEEPLHDAPLDDVLRDDLGHIRRGDVGVEGPLRIDEDHRAHGAQAEAAGLDHLGFPVHALLLQLPLEGLDDLRAVGEEQPVPVHTRMWARTKSISLSSSYSAAPMVYSVTGL